MEVFPRPVRIAPARFLRPVAAAKALGHLRSDFSHLANEGFDLCQSVSFRWSPGGDSLGGGIPRAQPHS